MIELVGDVGDVIAIESVDGDDGHLHAGGAFQNSAICFQALFAGGVDGVREIVDVAGGFQLGDVEGEGGGGEKQEANELRTPADADAAG